jgi:hypothetical protein
MKKISFFALLILLSQGIFAQDELMKELEKSDTDDVDYAFQTFKGTRLVNGHTIETKAKGNLEFIFAHRFGPVKGRLHELYGLDNAQVRLGLDYGITDNLSVSIGRNSVDKTVDGYLKYKLLRQSKGTRNVPVTVTAFAGVGYSSFYKQDKEPEDFEDADRLAYVTQLLIARKFSTRFSLQLMPTFIHRNAASQSTQNNDDPALGFGGRYKLTKSVALTGEYYALMNPNPNDNRSNTIGIGLDIETGGHVFQIVVTNTRGLTERAFIAETQGVIEDGDVFFGFNVTRTFQLQRKK